MDSDAVALIFLFIICIFRPLYVSLHLFFAP